MARKKKEELIQFNRSSILETAKKLFLEKGIQQTTMDDIAKEADYSKSTIYVYFKSKEEIYNYIIYEHMLLLKESLHKSIGLSQNNFRGCYYGICHTLIELQEQYPLYFESILGEISIKPKDFEEQPILLDIYHIGEEINKMIAELLQMGIDNKYIRPDIKPLQTTFTLWSCISSVISLADKKENYINMEMNISKQEFLQDSFDLILRSIIM